MELVLCVHFNGPESVVIVLPINNRLYGPQVFYEADRFAEGHSSQIRSGEVDWIEFGKRVIIQWAAGLVVLCAVPVRKIESNASQRSWFSYFGMTVLFIKYR